VQLLNNLQCVDAAFRIEAEHSFKQSSQSGHTVHLPASMPPLFRGAADLPANHQSSAWPWNPNVCIRIRGLQIRQMEACSGGLQTVLVMKMLFRWAARHTRGCACIKPSPSQGQAPDPHLQPAPSNTDATRRATICTRAGPGKERTTALDRPQRLRLHFGRGRIEACQSLAQQAANASSGWPAL
jgi:hypothetical protein